MKEKAYIFNYLCRSYCNFIFICCNNT